MGNIRIKSGGKLRGGCPIDDLVREGRRHYTNNHERKIFVYRFPHSWYIDAMKTITTPKLDRTAFSVASLTDPNDEKEYWLKKSPYDRLAAVETIRQIIYGYDPITTRLQRLFEVTQRT